MINASGFAPSEPKSHTPTETMVGYSLLVVPLLCIAFLVQNFQQIVGNVEIVDELSIAKVPPMDRLDIGHVLRIEVVLDRFGHADGDKPSKSARR